VISVARCFKFVSFLSDPCVDLSTSNCQPRSADLHQRPFGKWMMMNLPGHSPPFYLLLSLFVASRSHRHVCALCVLSLRCLQPEKRLVNQNSSKLCTSTALFKVEATRDRCQQIRRSCFRTTKYTDTLVTLVQSNVVPVSRWLVRLQSIFFLYFISYSLVQLVPLLLVLMAFFLFGVSVGIGHGAECVCRPLSGLSETSVAAAVCSP
jgi:hypothetical protein